MLLNDAGRMVKGSKGSGFNPCIRSLSSMYVVQELNPDPLPLLSQEMIPSKYSLGGFKEGKFRIERVGGVGVGGRSRLRILIIGLSLVLSNALAPQPSSSSSSSSVPEPRQIESTATISTISTILRGGAPSVGKIQAELLIENDAEGSLSENNDEAQVVISQLYIVIRNRYAENGFHSSGRQEYIDLTNRLFEIPADSHPVIIFLKNFNLQLEINEQTVEDIADAWVNLDEKSRFIASTILNDFVYFGGQYIGNPRTFLLQYLVQNKKVLLNFTTTKYELLYDGLVHHNVERYHQNKIDRNNWLTMGAIGGAVLIFYATVKLLPFLLHSFFNLIFKATAYLKDLILVKDKDIRKYRNQLRSACSYEVDDIGNRSNINVDENAAERLVELGDGMFVIRKLTRLKSRIPPTKIVPVYVSPWDTDFENVQNEGFTRVNAIVSRLRTKDSSNSLFQKADH